MEEPWRSSSPISSHTSEETERSIDGSGVPSSREQSKDRNPAFVCLILGFSLTVRPMLHYLCSLSIVVTVFITEFLRQIVPTSYSAQSLWDIHVVGHYRYTCFLPRVPATEVTKSVALRLMLSHGITFLVNPMTPSLGCRANSGGWK